MNDDSEHYLGIVQDDGLLLLWPEEEAGDTVRLTTLLRQAGEAPESREIDLDEYHRQALMVNGQRGGEWIYETDIIDRGGPIIAAVVHAVFDSGNGDMTLRRAYEQLQQEWQKLNDREALSEEQQRQMNRLALAKELADRAIDILEGVAPPEGGLDV